jgi:prevent-host-death family protein
LCGYNNIMNVATLLEGLDEATVSGTSISIGVRAAKNNFSKLLKLVVAGYEITITDHGNAVASLSGAPEPKTRLDELIAAGVVQPAKSPRFPLPPPMPNPWGGSPFTDEIIRERRGLPD